MMENNTDNTADYIVDETCQFLDMYRRINASIVKEIITREFHVFKNIILDILDFYKKDDENIVYSVEELYDELPEISQYFDLGDFTDLCDDLFYEDDINFVKEYNDDDFTNLDEEEEDDFTNLDEEEENVDDFTNLDEDDPLTDLRFRQTLGPQLENIIDNILDNGDEYD